MLFCLLWFENLKQLQYDAPQEHLFSSETISHITQDKQGGIWATSIENGLYYIPRPAYRSLNEPNAVGSYGPLLSLDDGVMISTRRGQLFHVSNEQVISQVQGNDQLANKSSLLIP